MPGLVVSDQVRHFLRRVGRAIFHFFVLIAVHKASVHLGVPLVAGDFSLELSVADRSAFEDLVSSFDIRLQHDSHGVSRSLWNMPADEKPFGVIVRIQVGGDA